MRFTQIPTNTFEQLQLNAGMVLTDFDPTDPDIAQEDILGATSGGSTFTAAATYRDNGEDIDNCPKNMKELKELVSWDVTLSGTLLTVSPASAAKLAAAADVSSNKITPRNDLKISDFGDIWWVGDYSDINDDTNGGFLAIHVINALSTGGFQLRSQDKAKGQFAFVFTGHYSMATQNTPPFELYVAAGNDGG